MPPVRHQGERNTCSAFAAIALMEYLVKAETGNAADLSEAWIYWAGKNLAPESATIREMYAHMDGLAGFLAVDAFKHGVMREADWPYEKRSWFQTGDSRCVQESGEWITECFTGLPPQAEPLDLRLRPIAMERSEIAAFLSAERKPVVFNIFYFPALFDDRGNQTRLPTPAEARACEQAGQGCYGHVILITGYDSGTRRFLFRNSWGPSWGSGGYGSLPEAHVVRHCEICPHLQDLSHLDPEMRKFVRRAAQGVSGTLE